MFGKINILTLVLLGSFFFLESCTTEEDGPFSDVPEITLDSISHDTVVQFMDNLVLSVSYKDGDGDLGFEEPSQYAIFIRDLRLDNFDGFYVGPLAPVGSEVPIQGTVHVEFPNLFVFGNRENEKTQFKIKMVDRAGNESNLVLSQPVVIVKE